MEILTQPLVLIFIITWLIEFYLFGMQRASLIISRNSNVEWRGYGEYLLPKWYPLTWIVRIVKYCLLVTILIVINWKLAISLFIIDLIASVIIPIPYKFLYSRTFRNHVKNITKTDPELGNIFNEMLNKANF
jgi:ABC-type multidrug transport system fused ATPase/permease subunit